MFIVIAVVWPKRALGEVGRGYFFILDVAFKNNENVSVKLLLYQIGGLVAKNCWNVINSIKFNVRGPLS